MVYVGKSEKLRCELDIKFGLAKNLVFTYCLDTSLCREHTAAPPSSGAAALLLRPAPKRTPKAGTPHPGRRSPGHRRRTWSAWSPATPDRP